MTATPTIQPVGSVRAERRMGMGSWVKVWEAGEVRSQSEEAELQGGTWGPEGCC